MREEIIKEMQEDALTSLNHKLIQRAWLLKHYPKFMEKYKTKLISESYKEILEHIKHNEPEV